MSILSATNLSQTFGFVDVFTGISVSVPQEAKVGLIGPNGVGKTSLLRILAGLDQPVTGSVSIAKGKRVGYLPQEAMDAFAGDDNTVYTEMLGVFEHLHAMEARMRELEAAMAHPEQSTLSLSKGGTPLDEYGELQERFTHEGGYDYEMRIAQTLDGLGFNRSNWDMPIAHLSGGQKTRALLAKLLLEQPDLLIMDEPTNHLDVEAFEWLEKTLIAWRSALPVVSHDRYFLDRVVNRIWEMSRARVEMYRGNYTAYTQQRGERFERSVFVFQQEKARLEKEMAYIKANDPPPVGPTPMSRGKLRRLTRDVIAIETFGAEALQNTQWIHFGMGSPIPFGVEEAEKRVKGLRSPSPPARIRLTLKGDKRGSEIALKTKKLVVGYRDDDRRPTTDDGRPSSVIHRLFEAGDVVLRWRERAALIGPNGAGKTTFIKTVLTSRRLDGGEPNDAINLREVVPPLKGEVELGPSMGVGYFAQAHDELDPDETVIGEVQRVSADTKRLSAGEARHYLAQFLFTQDDVFKPVSGLSGGERARLALAILQLKGANFLVMDEPTNHLDIAAQEVLQEVLEQYDGTILLISHDRYLINKLATQLWWIEHGKLCVFRDTYAEWVKWRERAKEPVRGSMRVGDQANNSNGTTTTASQRKSGGIARATRSDKSSRNADAKRKRQQQIAELEGRIASLEAKLKELGEAMQSVKGSDEARGLGIEYALAQRELDEAMKQWELLAR